MTDVLIELLEKRRDGLAGRLAEMGGLAAGKTGESDLLVERHVRTMVVVQGRTRVVFVGLYKK